MADEARQAQFAALLHEHGRIVFKVAAMYARDVHARDDLVQDIAAQLWRSFDTFDVRRAKFTTWMYRVALNVAISSLRARGRDVTAQSEPLSDLHAETVADPAGSAYAQVEHAERDAALRAFIDRLDPLNRALVLLYFEDRSYAEIAAVLGISATNVATKLNRIKQKLRRQMTLPPAQGARNGTR